MKKRFLSILLVFAMIISLAACGNGGNEEGNASASEGEAPSSESEAPASESQEDSEETPSSSAKSDYHIGIVTGTVSQGEDEYRAAQQAIKEYGNAADGGMISWDTYPDSFMAEQETTISKIAAMADDPLMKAIIVNQSVPGTVAAFKQVREKNPDIKLILLTPQEDIKMVEEAADLVVDVDNVARGYRLIAAAKKMGAKKFAHISFPRHMSVEMLALRRAIMKEACDEMGLQFISLTAPDPTSDVGIPGAQQYIADNIGPWIQKYGKDTAFYCTNDAHTEPLLRGVAEGGAIFVEPDLPSPIMGYPGAFSVNLKDVAGDWDAITKRVEKAVVDKGEAGRMGSWAYSYGYTSTIAAVDLAKDVVENGVSLTDREALIKAFEKRTPGAKWMSQNFIDQNSGKSVDNHLLVAQDTYVFGKGYLGMDKVEVPEKYLKLNVNDVKIEEENQ